MNNFKHLKKVLINQLDIINNSSSLFCENPDRDFTRERKLNMKDTMFNVICMETGSIKEELLKLNKYSLTTPTASAFIQARDKIKVDAFKSLFDSFNKATYKSKLHKGYRLLAIDGSELPIDSQFKDEDTTLRNCNHTGKSYSAYHINASYDLLECTYDDVIIQGQAKMDENCAFRELVDRYHGDKAIFIADRNYENYNGFEHVVHSGNKYLIRVRDINSIMCITRSLGPYPSDEFDIDVFRMLTLKQTKMIKACPQLYKFFPNNVKFDYMSKDNPWYEFNCRIVRFKITENTYECIITNLDKKEFPTDEIKELYNMRWGIETSFRELKYAIGLNALHSKKRKLIKQEIYARLLLHNFCQRIVQKVKIPKKKDRQYIYQVNFTQSFRIIREFLKRKTGGSPPVDDLIAKEILPIRPGRSDPRNVKPKHIVCFNYRYD